ncbi:MAG: GntR family transcriptional regulator [Streptosporangiaceae bacterium]|jgi:GntR family transcriptional regulator
MPDPLYRRIADELERQIESGALAPGAKLLSELELRRRYRASRNTVRDAVRWLTIRGRVETRPGQGTFVLQPPEPFVTTLSADPETGLGGGEGYTFRAEVRTRGRQPHAPPPQVEISRAAGLVAAELQIPEGTPVVGRRQRRFIDGAPSSLQASYYPMDLVQAGATRLLEAVEIDPGTVSYLRDALGLQQARYQDTITVRVPDGPETDFFGLPEDGRVSVFETFRTAFDTEDKPFRLTVSVFAADRNQFAVFVGQVPPEARKLGGLRPRQSGGGGDG